MLPVNRDRCSDFTEILAAMATRHPANDGTVLFSTIMGAYLLAMAHNFPVGVPLWRNPLA